MYCIEAGYEGRWEICFYVYLKGREIFFDYVIVRRSNYF